MNPHPEPVTEDECVDRMENVEQHLWVALVIQVGTLVIAGAAFLHSIHLF
jgi:hypothetical protein